MSKNQKFSFLAGHPFLDFVNTVDWRIGDEPADQLTEFRDLVTWFYEAKMIGRTEKKKLNDLEKQNPQAAKTALERAVDVRELGYRAIASIIEGKSPTKSDLRKINELSSSSETSIEWLNGKFTRQLASTRKQSNALVYIEAISRSFVEFLLSPEASSVSQCQDDRGCGWVFLSKSRGKRRRWCSMATCGNRAKAKRFYHRSE